MKQRRVALGVLLVVAASGATWMDVSTTPPTAVAACDMNVVPWDPYHQTCGIPNAIPTAPGQTPGAGAIIACRDRPACLAAAVNGPQLVSVPQRQ